MDMAKKMQVANSRQVYESITTEWEAYCAYEWGAKRRDSLPTIVDSAKVYRFMFYHAFREGKKPGGRKKKGGPRFDKRDYNRVQKLYDGTGFAVHFYSSSSEEEVEILPDADDGQDTDDGQDDGQTTNLNNLETTPTTDEPTDEPGPLPVIETNPLLRLKQPKKGLQVESLWQYRAVLRHVHRLQVARGANNYAWEHIWTDPCDQLLKLVQSRKRVAQATNYDEKMEAAFAPFVAVDKYQDIESVLWDQGSGHVRSAAAGLRNRYVLLHTTSAILRHESLEKAELSDFLDVRVQLPTDPHPIDVMVTQLPIGKFATYRVSTLICYCNLPCSHK